MTKEKLKWIIKRLPYILKMLRRGKREEWLRISKHKEKILIDEDVLIVLEIMDEIIENEKTEWLKKFFQEIRRGESDLPIILKSPIERTKYYQTKERFINKIYQCCIYKGIVKYDEILKEYIG